MNLEETIKFHKEQILSLFRRVNCGKCQLTNMKEFKDESQINPLHMQTLTFDVVYNNVKVGDFTLLITERYFEVFFRKSFNGFLENWSKNYWPRKYKSKRGKKYEGYRRPSFKSWGIQCKRRIKTAYETKIDVEVNYVMET